MKKVIAMLVLVMVLSGCSFFDRDPVYDDAFSSDSGMHLYYSQLTAIQQQDYESIYNCLRAYGDKVRINASSVEELGKIADAVIFDNPEIFYMANCMLSQNGNNYYFVPQYLFDVDEIESYSQQLNNLASIITSQLTSMDEYDQMVYLFEYVVNNNDYVANSSYNQTVISSMIYKETVCAGYAMMYQYLCDYLGINAGSMVGMSKEVEGRDSEYHQWNVVEYQGDFYYIDATWGDQEEGIAYGYCMFDSETMTDLYTPNINYPYTSDQSNTYFQKNNLYLDYYSLSQIENIIRNDNDNDFEVQFSERAYSVAKTKLITSQEIFRALENTGHLTRNVLYVFNDTTHTAYFEY